MYVAGVQPTGWKTLHTRTWRLNPTFPCYGSKPISGIIVLRHRHADLQTGSAFEAGYQTAWHPARGAIPQSNKQWVEMVVFMFFLHLVLPPNPLVSNSYVPF